MADSIESALDLGKGVVHIARVGDEASEPSWPVDRYSQHRVCDRCGRSFDELAPHHFSFNSPLGWCPVCEGLGIQQGANPAVLVPDGRLSLRQGAVAVWPDFEAIPSFARMIEALGRAEGIDLDHAVRRPRRPRPPDHPPRRGRDVVSRRWPRTRELGRGIAAKKARRQGSEASLAPPGLASPSSTRVCSRRSRRRGGSRLFIASSFRGWSTTFRAPAAWERGCATTRRPSGSRASRSTRSAAGRWARRWLSSRSSTLDADERHIAGDLVREVRDRLTFLVDVGLDYLSLARGTPTLSGGESQRIRLASQIGSGLTGVLYVLDEPTIGLHPRDNGRLLSALRHLRDLGNTLVLVEHDREVIEAADHLVDFGPGSGEGGGRITAAGTPAKVKASAQSLDRRVSERQGRDPRADQPPAGRPGCGRPGDRGQGARQHNLRNLDVRFPLGRGHGRDGCLGLGQELAGGRHPLESGRAGLAPRQLTPGAHEAIEGLEHINKVISVDQIAAGQHSQLDPGDLLRVFDLIRELFAKLPEAKVRGYSARRFSFNQAGGRCEACEGAGQKRIEMHFLPDVWITCDACGGARYTAETLAVKFHGKTIADVLDMSVDAALELFANVPRIRKILQTLDDVGLGYIPLGQAAPTLSGGEAQRVKLAAELARPDTGKTLYILDEPTTGLHFDDVRKLLDVIHRLADLGNTVIVIEHNLEVIKTADWVIDLGPEAGLAGGDLVAEGTPEEIVKNQRSQTGKFLKPVLTAGPLAERPRFRLMGDPRTPKQPAKKATEKQRSPERRPYQRATARNRASRPSRPKPRPPGSSTAGSGTPATASPATAGPALGRPHPRTDRRPDRGPGRGSRPKSTPAWPSPRPTGPNAISCGSTGPKRPRSASRSSTPRHRPNGSSTCGSSSRRIHSAPRRWRSSSSWCRSTRVRPRCSATSRGSSLKTSARFRRSRSSATPPPTSRPPASTLSYARP